MGRSEAAGTAAAPGRSGEGQLELEQTEALALAVERGARDPEKPRRFRVVPLGGAQRLLDGARF